MSYSAHYVPVIDTCASTAFDAISPAAYDTWRRKSEFFEQVEYPTISPLLASGDDQRVLDIGSGTGVWTAALSQLRPNSQITGVDPDTAFVDFARERRGSTNIVYKEQRAELLEDPRGFNTIVAAMSLDYVGTDRFVRCLERNLRPHGVALAWILSPQRYQRVAAGHCRKGWQINDRIVEVTVEIVSPLRMMAKCREIGCDVSVAQRKFQLSDGIQRELLLFRIARR